MKVVGNGKDGGGQQAPVFRILKDKRFGKFVCSICNQFYYDEVVNFAPGWMNYEIMTLSRQNKG